MTRRTLLSSATVAALWAWPGTGGIQAQTVRVSGITSVRYVEVRSLVEDSVSVASTTGDGLYRRDNEGRLVRCLSGAVFCRFHASGPTLHTLPTVQDVTLNGWGLGRGIRVHARLRARASPVGEDDLWPRSDDAFDALAAYLEIERARFTARLGRDWKATTLGYYNFDGASLALRPGYGVSLDIWGGWSLAPGLNEARTSGALEAIEPFAPDERGVILGARARWRPTPEWAATVLYQRDIRQDRLSLYAERAAASLFYRTGRGSVEASVETDLVGRDINEASLDARYLPHEEVALGAFVRRHRPFFELWTIWGAFSPVGFDEAGLKATWLPGGTGWQLGARGAWRSYDEGEDEVSLVRVRSSGWRLGASAAFQPGPVWRFQASWHADVGLGAGISEGTLHVRRSLGGTGSWLGVGATAFQRAHEFRVSEGTVVGFTADAGHRLGSRTRISGGLALYRHAPSDATPSVDWSQLRGNLRLEWTVGAEPGMDSVPPGGGS